MEYRKFGRTNWNVSEIGYGMWGLADWTGADKQEIDKALALAIESGCNFFDTAWAYGDGKSEQILSEVLRAHASKKLLVATKIPAKNFTWPSKPSFTLAECFPASHIIEYTEKSLKNLKVDCIDLQQFHVWEDGWANQDEWKTAIEKLKKEGKVKHFGVSVNRWEPDNVLNTLQTGFIDAVQVIYNIFDQAPEDNLFPLCRKLNIGVIARVPFDEGTLTGMLTKDTVFPKDDWRSTYFVPENLNSSVEHADALKPLIPSGMTMAEMALRFILCNDDVHTIIPGMRKVRNVKANVATSDGKKLEESLRLKLKQHRWDRTPTAWSQ
jgi:aryl-alcohol dehydrogenase-like predicted oxidoreductase